MSVINYKGYECPFTERIFSHLPKSYRDAYMLLSQYDKSLLSEIRLRAGMPSSFTVSGINRPVVCDGGVVKSDEGEISEILERLCGGSMYSYSEQIARGYLNVLGTRVGVGGIACSSSENTADFSRITSLCIRIPRNITSAADRMTEHIRAFGVDKTFGILAVSPPNCGKTTFLRALARSLSVFDGEFKKRVCIADERGEICTDGAFDKCFCDCLVGVPKTLCAEIASRTLSAEILVIDEIGNSYEAERLLSVCNSGIYVAASVHAGSLCEAMKREYVSRLVSAGIFKTAYVLERRGDSIVGRIEKIYRENGCG